tara:strand:+ start:4836 stop:5357 length:522 start_codon:yes stop_codon:yes gene_type:complete
MGIVIKKEKTSDNVFILTETPYNFIRAYSSDCLSITHRGDIVSVNTADSLITFDINDVAQTWLHDASPETFTGTAEDLAELLAKRFFTVEKRDANEIAHQQVTNPSSFEVSVFKRLSFTCDGSIAVNIGGTSITYPYTAGGSTVVGANIECDSENSQVVEFTGTGTLTFITVS